MRCAVLLCALGAASAVDVEIRYHRVKSFDGTELTANSWEPKEITSPLPLVITSNSWGVPGFEYVWPGYEMAEMNYIALQYTCRGWYTSGGKIGTAGPDDVRDHEEIVSWALKHWGDKVNASAIAVGGISYGGGMSLLAASNDSRITAVFSMSTWGSLVGSLWWNQAPSTTWLDLLLSFAYSSGKPADDLEIMSDNLRNYKNIDETIEWGQVRSPIKYIDQLNARKVPVLISNQFEDYLFHSHQVLSYWQQLQGPKHLFLNQGTHAEADLEGDLPPLKNRIWQRTFAWLDLYLKGVQNNVDALPLVELSLSDHHDPLIPGNPVFTHVNYSSWPPVLESEKYAVQEYSLVSSSVAGTQFGKLVESAGTSAGSDMLDYTNSTGMTIGSNSAEQPLIPHTINILKLNSSYDVAFLTEPMKHKTRVCGTFNVTGLVGTANTDRFQVMGYLWSVKEKNFFGAQKAALLSHAPQDIWTGAKAGKPFAMRDLTFHAACRDLKKGTSLMLGFNLHALQYEGANMENLRLQLDYSKAVLHVATTAVV
eukprot:TRINITY_DN97_c0_g1_i14.p1 TRINITY_DN97_c0_g1~~TRINITY_DN97_c0_g1_i14.p1  ORF type:complete len:553 (+),score=236.78 TRINITY_DN97_c0_g1_i14:47-1660(+)